MIKESLGSFKRNRLLTAVAIGLCAFVGTKYASASEVDIRKSIETLYPNAKVQTVTETAAKGVFEVVVGQEVVYSDITGRFLFFGPMIDAANRVNLTEVKKDKLLAVNFKDLPLELAVKSIKGDGSRVFAAFEDPNCGYCKRMHETLKKVDNYTLYTFLTPILSEDSKVKSRQIWCSSDRGKALSDWMNMGVIPTGSGCETPIDQVLALAQKLGVKGTPTMVFESGKRVPGFVPPEQLEQLLNTNKAISVSKR